MAEFELVNKLFRSYEVWHVGLLVAVRLLNMYIYLLTFVGLFNGPIIYLVRYSEGPSAHISDAVSFSNVDLKS